MSIQILDTIPLPQPRTRKKPILVTAGSCVVKIYRTRWHDKKRRRHYHSHVVTWRAAGPDGPRLQREKFASLEVARERASQIAVNISNGNIALEQLTTADRAAYCRAVELLRPTGKPLELAASEYAGAVTQLAGVSLDQVVQFYLRHQPPKAGAKTCPDILEEMLRDAARDGKSPNTINDYESRIGRFTKQFTGPVTTITASDINDWLRKLDVSNRTRNNYRGNLSDFFRYAKECGYLPKLWAQLDDVPKVKNEPVRIRIFTPEELVKLFAVARPNLIPYLAIACLAGVRHEEMSPEAAKLPALDWRQVDFDKSEIHLLPEVARKIGRDRIIPMCPALVAWLRPHARPNGRVCELRNVTNALLRAATAAGVEWKDNGPRKSFISYRLALTKNIGQVADEAGNSPDRIRQNYKKTVPVREAKRWFDTWPSTSEILQLPLALGQ